MSRSGDSPRNPRFGRTRRFGANFSNFSNFKPRRGFVGNRPITNPESSENDFEGGPDYPGVKLPKEQWTRTRVGLGNRGVRFDWNIAFGRTAPRVVDLGCGNGRFIISSALARRDADHLGVELVPPAVRLGSLRAGQRGLMNCKFAWGDATEFITERCEHESIDEVHLYHPQPYFDANKKERRQLSPEVYFAIFNALKPGGLFVFQTDNAPFFEYTKNTAPRLFDWRIQDGPWPDAPAGRTLREIVARAKGLPIYRAQGRKLNLNETEAAKIVAEMPSPDFDATRPEKDRWK